MDFAEARRHMVDGQLRPTRVEEPRLVAALREMPRERFVPPALAARAYADADVPLPGGRAMLKPLVIARLVQLTELRRGERALVLAAGTGYGAALLGAIGGSVTAIEADPELVAIGQKALEAAVPAGTVVLQQGDPGQGLAASAPFDVILIEGGVTEVPKAIEEQLAEGGRLVTVSLADAPPGRAIVVKRIGGAFSRIVEFDAHAPALPGFAGAPAFAF